MKEDVEIRRYQVPTHLKTDDRITVGFFTFTFRQLAVLLVGGGAAYEVWHQFPAALALVLGATLALWLKVGVVGGLVLFTLALAFVRRRGRTLESWFVVWLSYVMQPRCYRWRRQPDPALVAAPPILPVAEASEEA